MKNEPLIPYFYPRASFSLWSWQGGDVRGCEINPGFVGASPARLLVVTTAEGPGQAAAALGFLGFAVPGTAGSGSVSEKN